MSLPMREEPEDEAKLVVEEHFIDIVIIDGVQIVLAITDYAIYFTCHY